VTETQQTAISDASTFVDAPTLFPERLPHGLGRHRCQAAGPAVSVGTLADWIKIKNPSAPAATRLIER
jgi:hypothetical protein